MSPVEITAQDGRFFQAGTPVGSENANSERGRWVADIRAVCSTLRSAPKTSWNFLGSIVNSAAVFWPSPVRYWSGIKAGYTAESFELLATAPRVSPSLGAKAAI